MTTPDQPPPPGTVPPPEEPGGDPWLPARLAALAFLLGGEALLFKLYLDMMRDWFSAIRSLIWFPKQQRIDPYGVYGAPEVFQRGLRRFLDDGVEAVFVDAMDEVFDEPRDFNSLQATIDYIREVENKMVRTPDEVFDLVRMELEEAVIEGLSIPEIAERIDQVLLDTNTERWQNRATTVARTETVGAYNGGTDSAFAMLLQEDPELDMEKVWLATMDSRTRDTHFQADGQRVAFNEMFQVGGFPAMHPGDKALPAHECINCRCTALYVEKGEKVDSAGRGWKASRDTNREVKARAKRGIHRSTDRRFL